MTLHGDYANPSRALVLARFGCRRWSMAKAEATTVAILWFPLNKTAWHSVPDAGVPMMVATRAWAWGMADAGVSAKAMPYALKVGPVRCPMCLNRTHSVPAAGDRTSLYTGRRR